MRPRVASRSLFRVSRVGDGQAAPGAVASSALFVDKRRSDGHAGLDGRAPHRRQRRHAAVHDGGLRNLRRRAGALVVRPLLDRRRLRDTARNRERCERHGRLGLPVGGARRPAPATSIPSTSFATAESGYNARSAVSLDGAGISISGSSDVWYGLFGAATQAGTTVLAAPSNVRWLAIFGGQLSGSSGSSGFTDVFTIGAGLPVTVNQTATPLPGLPTTGASPYGFVFFDLDATVAGNDTLYLADDMAGLQKWTFDGSSWSQVGTLNLPSPVGFRAWRGSPRRAPPR